MVWGTSSVSRSVSAVLPCFIASDRLRSAAELSLLSQSDQLVQPIWWRSRNASHASDSLRNGPPPPDASLVPHSEQNTAAPRSSAACTLPRRASPWLPA